MVEPDAITEDELLAILRRAEAVKDNGPATYDHATRVALADVSRLVAEIHRLKDRLKGLSEWREAHHKYCIGPPVWLLPGRGHKLS